MTNQRSRLVIGIVAMVLLVVALPLIGACATKPPEEGGALKLGLSICMTGPAGEKGSPMGHGKLDCIKYINEELG
ncbi:MAG: ABC transporter substrate-binding protein, partial [Dehalococcoidia bacterium]|nr:ABC transporter substrate-binding protein [Dehalococcoidia bacterium]